DLARVDAPTLYRHFPSKADLFEAATLGSLKDFLENHFTYWRASPPGVGDPEALARHFVVGFFEALEAHRESFRILLTSSADASLLGDLARSISAKFREGLVTLREVVVDEAHAHGWSLASPDAVIGASTGMVLSMVLFDDWVFPEGRRPSREEQI